MLEIILIFLKVVFVLWIVNAIVRSLNQVFNESKDWDIND
jgi:hypothetical protein